MAVGTKLFFDMMHEHPPKVMLFGGSCSHVTAPIAESAVWWNMWQVNIIRCDNMFILVAAVFVKCYLMLFPIICGFTVLLHSLL